MCFLKSQNFVKNDPKIAILDPGNHDSGSSILGPRRDVVGTSDRPTIDAVDILLSLHVHRWNEGGGTQDVGKITIPGQEGSGGGDDRGTDLVLADPEAGQV